MCRNNLDSRLCFVLGLALLVSCVPVSNSAVAAQEITHMERTNEDRSLECIDRVLGKRAVASMSVDANWLISPCPDSRSTLVDVLKRDGLRLFEAGEFAFVIPSKSFPPLPAGYDAHWPQVKWSQIRIVAQIKPAEGMSQNQADAIGRDVLERARLIPLDASYSAEGTASLQLNIYLYQAHLSPALPVSIIAWVNHLPDASAGRFVYGEIRENRFVMLWDSPLFSGAGNPDFDDVNGDAIAEIVIQSHLCGNGCEEFLSIFDKDAQELTRQKNCEDNRPGWVCGIEGAGISLVDAADGKKEIQVSGGSDGKDHAFKLVNGLYTPFPPFIKPVPLDVREAAEDNVHGMELMKKGDYERAATSFVNAARMMGTRNDSTAALYANNAGFAYYKVGKYEESVTWLKAAVEDDPRRAVAYLNLGDAYAKLSRNAEAREAYKKYLELAPDSKAAPDVKKKLEALAPTP
jgi:hypothetical protein